MIYHNVEQRSADWFKMRLFLPTASEFHKIVSPTGKLSKQADGYAHLLLAEAMLGRPMESVETAYMVRGQETEDQAIAAFEFWRGIDTQPGGFVTNDAGTYGCSPDRLVGDSEGLEIKVPSPHVHIGYLLNPDSMLLEKKPQVLGNLLITERENWYLFSYHPELPPVILKVERDEEYIDKLRTALDEFTDNLAKLKADLITKYGAFPEIVIGASAAEPRGDFDISDEDLDRMYPQFAER